MRATPPQSPRLRTRSTTLKLTQRFRRLSTSFKSKKTLRKLLRAQERLELLEAERRHQLLLLKELQQQAEQLKHRLQELSPSLSPTLLLSARVKEELQDQLRLSPTLQEFLEATQGSTPQQ